MRTSETASRFRYETDLVDVLEPRIASTLFRRDLAQVVTFREVPAARGVPDLVLVRFDQSIMDEREARAIRPLSSDLEVRIVRLLRECGSLSSSDIAARLNVSRDHLKRSVLPMLDQLGWLQRTNDQAALVPGTAPIAQRVITVEAKLRDWLGAFNQARSQALSSDAAYIAIDDASSSVPRQRLAEIAARGVGVIAVSAERRTHRVLARPRTVLPKATRAAGRELLAERSYDLLRSGERAGQVSPVFGWVRPVDFRNG